MRFAFKIKLKPKSCRNANGSQFRDLYKGRCLPEKLRNKKQKQNLDMKLLATLLFATFAAAADLKQHDNQLAHTKTAAD